MQQENRFGPMPGSPPVLALRNIRKAFGDLSVLRDISLAVDQGNVVSVIGPSGSGKSTLLRCATFLETADAGNILYDGQYAMRDGLYGGKKELREFRRRFGLVFQNFNLFPHYSVMKNITEAPVLRGFSRTEAEEKAFSLLKKMGLEGKENAYPCQLSGGQQQRVAIARALAMEPEILFFDEPTSALDPELTGEVLKVIRQLADENMTMVIVTHEMAFARAVSEWVVFMDGGVIIEEGPPESVLGDPSQERTRQFLRNYQQ